jgi:Ran GTPase-activating protein (RanGAP) involved in mRNA processing and transport
MIVNGKDIKEWADIIEQRKKEFEKLSPEEKQGIEQETETMFDRWQAETDAME